jgi:cation diffusion facilitator CzcD-associated flavoprotein CzcO
MSDSPQIADHDVIVVGAGFAGMYMLHRMRELGLDARVYERATGVGGTWYWNRYPGARCDVESMQYSYQFDKDLQQEWDWSERYAGQPEILTYANHVADRFNLRDAIQFETTVQGVVWDETTERWSVTLHRADGVVENATAQFVVMATGCLSSENTPKFDGMETFEGPIFHTGKWPHEGVEFTGMRVAVIGTGSSAVQSIPVIAEQCEALTVFQRTPNYSAPARNAPLDSAEQAAVKANYDEMRAEASIQNGAILGRFPAALDSALDAGPEEIKRRLDERWAVGGFSFYGAFADTALNRDANELMAEYARAKIRSVVDDPATAEALTPTNTFACKRPVLDTGYFETFNMPHVSLVDVSQQPIERFSKSGVIVGDTNYEVDCIVLATGFDAMTGTLLKMGIVGRDALPLGDKWEAGPRTYLGLGVPGFPNLFTVSGPGSPSVLTNMIVSIEQHVDWITDCIAYIQANGHHTIEATEEAGIEWVDHVNTVADATLFPTCNSWYLGANIPGKTRVFMPLIGFPPYVEKCDEVAANGYEGFVLA